MGLYGNFTEKSPPAISIQDFRLLISHCSIPCLNMCSHINSRDLTSLTDVFEKEEEWNSLSLFKSLRIVHIFHRDRWNLRLKNSRSSVPFYGGRNLDHYCSIESLEFQILGRGNVLVKSSFVIKLRFIIRTENES